MLKITSRPSVKSSEQIVQPQIIFSPQTPNKIKVLLKQLYYPVPRYFNEKIIQSEYFLQIIPYITSWSSLNSLYLDSTQTRKKSSYQMLKCITLISYPNLQQFYLQNMKLDSFEFLQFIDAPNLKILYLAGNEGRIIKSLGKCEWKKMEKLELNSGFSVEELKSLQRMRLSTNGGVVNQLMEDHRKGSKKQNSTKIVDNLLLIWPKMNYRKDSKVIEQRMDFIRKRF